MAPAQIYKAIELNDKIISSKLEYRPRGMCYFYSILEYKFGDLVSKTIMESGKKTTIEKWIAFTQKELNQVVHKFHTRVIALRLEAQLSGDAALHDQLLNEPIHGSYTTYVGEYKDGK
jgi:hypothetical protein